MNDYQIPVIRYLGPFALTGLLPGRLWRESEQLTGVSYDIPARSR